MARVKIRVALAITLACFVAPAPAAAQTPALPVLTQPVNDLAHVIDPANAEAMDRQIRALQSATGDAVVVATVPTFAPYGSIEEYAVKLYERAGIGAKGKDNGVLLLVAVDDHRARIEVGYGMEGFLTDGFCGDVIRSAMLPAFRRNAYGDGLLDATTQVISRIAKERGVTIADLPAAPPDRDNERHSGGGGIGGAILVILIILFVIGRGGGSGLLGFILGQALANAGRRSRSGWSGWNGGFGGGGFGGGGLGGGFGGFGGGMSGGGGASGGW